MKKNTKKVGLGLSVLSLGLILSLTSMAPVAGAGQLITGEDGYISQYGSLYEVLEAGRDINLQLQDEGSVLLKNNGFLPMSAANKVTVLGQLADTPCLGGGGSGAQQRPRDSRTGESPASAVAKNIYDGLDKAGIRYNNMMKDRYAESSETPYTQSVGMGSIIHEKGTYMVKAEEGTEAQVEFDGIGYNDFAKGTQGKTVSGISNIDLYNDAAIIYIGRSGSEGADNPIHDVYNHTRKEDHVQTLNDSEREMIAYAKAHFDHVIVLLNTPSAMEIGNLEDDDAIDAILWIGQPGWNGLEEVGRILTGEVNPSGRLVDFWAKKFEYDPSWYNFGDYSGAIIAREGDVTGLTNTEKYPGYSAGNTYGIVDTTGAGIQNNKAMDYAEGIYMGYRYYETVATDLGDKGEAWYQEHALYPFGYGLSYSSFSQEIVSIEGDINNPDGKVTVNVKVTNTGKVAGKEVVQLYKTAKYTPGGIEHAACDLVDFGKTKMLKPGAHQIVKLEVSAYDLASFDMADLNKNNNSGWELEAGDIELSIRKNSHEVLDSKKLNVSKTLTWDADGNPDTPNNIYSQKGNAWEQYNTQAQNWIEDGEDHYLTRAKLVENGEPYDLKKLSWILDEGGNVVTDAAKAALLVQRNNYIQDHDNYLTSEVETDYQNLWVKTNADIPASWTQRETALPNGSKYEISLYDMMGVSMDDPKWDEFMNQLTYAELQSIAANSGTYRTQVGTTIFDKATVTDQDGPGQLKISAYGYGWAYVCEVTVASTWNQELAHEQGKIIGNESNYLHGGWYGPAMNTHRGALAGRNFEYYSQDGVQGGKIAAANIAGAQEQGCRVFAKHAFLNDQETTRMSTVTWATEQAIREIYARDFEYAIKEGHASCTMTAFNHIGLASSLGYATNIQLYENEWGFEGYSCTDYYMSQANEFWNYTQLVRGHTVALGTGNNKAASVWDATLRDGKGGVKASNSGAFAGKAESDTESPTQYYWERTSAKRILYTIAQSNEMQCGVAGSRLSVAEGVDAMTAGTAVSGNIFDEGSQAILNLGMGDTGYVVSATGLPEGVSISANGTLSGRPTTAGTYNATIRIQGKYGKSYIEASKTVRFTVSAAEAGASAVTLDNANATFNTAYSAVATQSITNESNYVAGGQANAANLNKYTAYSFSADGLPAGLSIAADGTISGTPTVTGDYDVTINVRLTKVIQTGSGWRVTYGTTTETQSATVKISIGGGYNVTIVDGYGNTVKVIGIADGETLDLSTIDVSDTRAPGVGMTPKALSGVKDAAETVTIEWNYPAVTMIDGNWVIDGVDTGIKAAGQVGPQGATGETGAQGIQGPAGDRGQAGVDGVDGVGVAKVEINANGELVVTLTDGTVSNLGKVVGANGADGAQGPQGPAGTNGADGATGPQGPQGPAGEPGADGKGCGSVIGATGAVAALTALLGAAIALKKKED